MSPEQIKKWGRFIALSIIGVIIIAVFSQLSLELPVDHENLLITGQSLGIFLVTYLSNRRLALTMVIAYLLLGIAGVPVFAGNHSGLGYFLGPSGGYLYGYIPAAFLLGNLAEKEWNRNVIFSMIIITIATFVVMLFGVIHLAFFLGWREAFVEGFFGMIVQSFLKMIVLSIGIPIIVKIYHSIWKK